MANFSSLPVLATKLYVPRPNPQLVARPRLMEILDRGLTGAVTLISAPPGFGKTTLLSDWIAQSGRRAAWLSLDEHDSDPVHFVRYLIAALRTISPSLGEPLLPLLASAQQPPLDLLLAMLANEVAQLSSDSILVLDDYHALHGQEAHRVLGFLVEHLPPQLHLVISTREDPPLPLSRLRARGLLCELRAADLRFTPSEAAEFLTGVMGLKLTGPEVRSLEERTEGWIAGLQLAALSMQGLRDTQEISGFISAFGGSHRHVLDYLAEEALNRLPGHLHRFLLKTSILDRLCGPLCDALMDEGPSSGGEAESREPAQSTLEYLERANLFLLPLDNERRWYRYHQLFAGLLRARLAQEEPGIVQDLHRRAAAWYEANGFREYAIEHALAGSDYERAARLIGDGLRGLSRIPIELGRLLAWFEALPADFVRSQPRTTLDYAWLMTALGRHEEAELYIEAAKRMLEKERSAGQIEGTREERRRLASMLGETAAVSASLASQRGDLQRTIDRSRLALQLLAPEEVSRRAAVHFYLATAYQLRGDVQLAARNFAEAEKLSRSRGDNYITLLVMVNRAGVDLLLGRLHEAAHTCLRALELPGVRDTPFRGIAHVVLGLVLSEWNELEGAEEHLNSGISAQEPIRDWNTNMVAGFAELARIKRARGDLEGAAAEVEKAGELAARTGRPGIAKPAEWARVKQLLATGDQADLAAAGRWADGFRLRSEEMPTVRLEAETILVARVRMAQGLAVEALRLLLDLRADAEEAGRSGRLVEVLVLQAMALLRLGETKRALVALGEGLVRAEPGGYVRLFLDEGDLMAGLLADTYRRGIAREQILRLLPHVEAAAARSVGEKREAETTRRQTPGLVEPLTEREQQVLRLLADGLSGPEIATILVVGLSTIKTHLKNIYGKLGAHSRDQALLRARELNLL